MMRKNITLIVVFFCFFNSLSAQDNRIVVHFKENDAVLTNPGKGFSTFQQFNGDTANVLNGCCGNFKKQYPFSVNRNAEGMLVNNDYPQTTMAYFRFYWRYIEPKEGKYRWEVIDEALKTANKRGQTLMLSIMPYGSEGDEENDVPVWYRKIVGEQTDWKYDNPVNKWLVNPENPRYVKYYGGMIRALGERYDGHPDLESIDARIVGAWGEGGGTEMLSEVTMQGLMDAYLESFKNTPVISMLHGKESVRYARSKKAVGWRQDCLGDLGFWASDEDDWTHMYDYYPRTIIEYGMKDAWKQAPVTFEICGNFRRWKEREGYGLEQVKYIFNQALKWHISTFNAKSSPIPEKWRSMVDEWLKKMGYRFVLRRFSYPRQVRPNGKLSYTSWWENKGVAPIYRRYPLVLRLKGSEGSTTLLTDADVRTWMPGDNLSDGSVYVPANLPLGKYKLQLALVAPFRNLGGEPKPAVKLAIDGRTPDGWYTLGKIMVAN